MAKGKRRPMIPSELAGIVTAVNAEVNPPKVQKTTTAGTGKKKIPMARVFVNGEIATLTEKPASVEQYINGFLALPPRGSAGYDSFISTKDGFTSSKKFRTFTAQATGKMLSVLLYRAGLIMAAGGDDAKAMQHILDGIDAWRPNGLKAAQRDFLQLGLMEAYVGVLESLNGDHKKTAERLVDFAKKNNLTMPT